MPPQSEEQFAVIDAAATPNNELVAAVTDKRIRVLGFFLVSLTAVGIRFESGPAGAALTGVMTPGANGRLEPAFNPLGHFQTVAGQSLNLELASAVQVSGALTYVLID